MDRSVEKYQQQLEASRNWKAKNKERHAELARAYRTRNREKTKAQNQLNYAIRCGRMERLACEKCGTCERVHAHHHDYSKPLDVHWLCYQCHKLAHPVDDEDLEVKFDGAKKSRLQGAENSNASLSEEQVRQVRVMLELKLPQQRIADAFGVSQTTISRIKLGRHYAGT
jgi:hypothetical protein